MYILTNGISTYYERSGAGLPVVLVHALGGSVGSWGSIAGELSQHHDVIMYDWRGHGRTEKAMGEYSLPILAKDLADLISGLDVRTSCVVGVAVGAMIALQTALDHPKIVSSLVLAEGCSKMDPSGAQYTSERAAKVEQQGMRVAVGMTIERAFVPGFAESHPHIMREFQGDFLANDPHSYASASRVVVGLDLVHRLGEVTCPTLLLVGEMDRLLPPSGSRLIQSNIPGSRLEVLPGVGHFSLIEAPELFAACLLRFLGDIKG